MDGRSATRSREREEPEGRHGNKNNIIECNLREMFVSVEFNTRVDDFG